ncbi:MAG: sodium:proton antiporter [Rhizomicrobium sp.]
MDVIIVGTLGLLIVAILVAIVARRLALPYTVGLVAAGVALAFSRIDFGITLTHDIIFELILPPLLFEAALNIHWHELRRDMLPVLVLSILGVAICAAIVSAGMMWIFGWPIAAALVFGVLIAATDPVAVIAMFKDTGIGGRLRLLVESESLFNDGVAAVLFGLIVAWAAGGAWNSSSAAFSLITVSGGGIAIGAGFGIASILLAGRTPDHLAEAAITVVVAYGAFLTAETFHFSGVLATVTAGLVVGSAGVRGSQSRPGLSDQARDFILEFWEFAAFIANSLVFLLIGVTVARIDFHAVGEIALLGSILLVLLGRAATVYPLSLMFRGSRWAIGMREQHILWWGGLRGALALALALALPASIPMRDTIVIATFAVVAFSVVVQGLTMPWLLKKLGFSASQP